MANTNKVKLHRPNGVASISTKAKAAVILQAATAVALVVLTGEITVETLTPGVTALVSGVLALFIKDTVPEGTTVQYPDVEDEFEI